MSDSDMEGVHFDSTLVGRYILVGLRLGKHIDGLVDAYYGPQALAARVKAEPVFEPARLAEDVRGILRDLDDSSEATAMDTQRVRWIRAQAHGLATVAAKLAGRHVGYADEVEACYGVRPSFVDEEVFLSAHRALDKVLPGSGPLMERYILWRESHAVPAEILNDAVHSLAEDFRERTAALFALPDGEHVEFEMVTNQPWSGFNYYLGDLQSRVAINTDLPVLSSSLGHLVAHEAYPGHHSEHSRKEVGLVRKRGHFEESIFLVGTPQCLLAEGLADLGLEVIAGDTPETVIVEHLKPLGIEYDAEIVAAARKAGDALGAVRGNVAWLLNEEGRSVEECVEYLMRWSLLPKLRAEKAIDFLTDPTWRAYISCYVEGLPLCRRFVSGDSTRFERLLSEQLIPQDLATA